MINSVVEPAAALETIIDGRTVLGIELGSTRIKGVLLDERQRPIASGTHSWENEFRDGVWTYPLSAADDGVRQCMAALLDDVRRRYDVDLTTVASLGISGMMHGYLAFDEDGELLVPFRTWRTTTTQVAADRLTAEFGANLPLRWSIAHLYQAMLDREDHLERLARITTLAGYIHGRLTGEFVIGICEASGMCPVDTTTRDWDATVVARFDELAAVEGFPLSLGSVLPRVLCAGDPAGELSEQGALFLDPTGQFRPGAPLCPPEGDAGTGMVATNTVAPRTANVSAGTSIFTMAVLTEPLHGLGPEIDQMATPGGDPCVMVHCNNGASELHAWARLFSEFAAATGHPLTDATVFGALFGAARDGAVDGGGLLAYNYLSGEPLTGLDAGRPLVLRTPDGRFDLGTFVRTQLYSALATLRLGMDVLSEHGVEIDGILAHGGMFATPGVAQEILAAALDIPVAVGETAAEGGAWGVALLASYLVRARDGETLAEFLARTAFADASFVTVEPDPMQVQGFATFLQRYRTGLAIERAAVEHS